MPPLPSALLVPPAPPVPALVPTSSPKPPLPPSPPDPISPPRPLVPPAEDAGNDPRVVVHRGALLPPGPQDKARPPTTNLSRLTTVLTTTATTVIPPASTPTAWNTRYHAWSGSLPAPGSVGVRGSSPLSSTHPDCNLRSHIRVSLVSTITAHQAVERS